jgi:hypothetical protein
MPVPQIPDDLDDIVGMTDPVIRNLFITQRYHDLSLGLRAVVDRDNVNWSTFATWASKTAGETIRDEEVPKVVVGLLDSGETISSAFRWAAEALRTLDPEAPPGSVSVPILFGPVRKMIEDLAEQIAIGNLKVFGELAPIFADFVQTFDEEPQRDPRQIDAFVERLTPGPVEKGGQDLLREAFRGYWEARYERDAELKAQRILASNVQIGLHEQTRLQPQIKAALDEPVEELIRDQIHAVARASVPSILPDRIAQALAAPLDPMIDRIGRLFRRIATRHMMNLTLPLGERLSLGDDISPSAATRCFLRRCRGSPARRSSSISSSVTIGPPTTAIR